jgi:glycosyltransferase involved in cell wall biosynthesis
MKMEGDIIDVPEERLSFANHTNGNTWDQPEHGFLTIVTRTWKRKEKLAINQRSISNQSDGDWDQIIIHDQSENGIGLLAANGLFNKHRKIIKGDYVLLLDDDDKIIDDDFIRKLKQRDEDIVLFKMQYTSCGKDRWNYLGEEMATMPTYGKIGGSCMVVKNHVFQRFANVFEKDNAGDFAFLKEILDPKNNYTRYHMGDQAVTAVQSVGGGGRMER